jgi:hypothetical protein
MTHTNHMLLTATLFERNCNPQTALYASDRFFGVLPVSSKPPQSTASIYATRIVQMQLQSTVVMPAAAGQHTVSAGAYSASSLVVPFF